MSEVFLDLRLPYCFHFQHESNEDFTLVTHNELHDP
jgi:hypothetical protein